ncbi:MAG TPA: BON domain-containing protein [Gemmataceae bacterium]|jgi:hypothetical protein|nr:BON domain-containing protein [Gemmataceae bacterium]
MRPVWSLLLERRAQTATIGPIVCRLAVPPAVLAAVLFLGPAAEAALWGIEPDPSAKLTANDCRLTVAALGALARDKELAPVNLGLSVHENVAMLWGPVPSGGLKRRAEELIRRVPGIGQVVNQLYVEAPPEEETDPFWKTSPTNGLYAPDSPPTRNQPWRPPERALAVAPGGRLGAGPAWGPPVQAVRAQAIPVVPPIRIVSRPASALAPAAVLLAPRPIPVRPADLTPAFDRLLLGDARFRRVRPEVRGGFVFLHGTVWTWADLHALAKEIAQLPGVQRVILEDVQAESR